jgi:antitoxin (DNA-binding transcriptional repressor) of toxin-antitoxin stability system
VSKTRQPIRVTHLGEALAEIVPLSPAKNAPRQLGSLVGTATILGDIVGPTGSLSDWNAAAEDSEKELGEKGSRRSSPRKSKAYLRR